MLALVLTLILALYILGPDVFSRLIVSLFAPARIRTRNRSEEIARAIIISFLPVLAIFLVAHFAFHRFYNVSILRDFLRGLYGERSLADHSDAFFAAATTIIWLNLKFLLLPVYGFTLAWSLSLGYCIHNYGPLLRKTEERPKVRGTLTWFVRPWVAEWHLKLSKTLLPNPLDYIRVDVLTKMNILFRGTLIEHHLGPDGSLVSLTLTDPQKFKREELLADRAAKPRARIDTSLYWSKIEARSFIIMGSEIVTLNLNYVDPASLDKKPVQLSRTGAKRVLDAAAKSNSASSRPRTRSVVVQPDGRRKL